MCLYFAWQSVTLGYIIRRPLTQPCEYHQVDDTTAPHDGPDYQIMPCSQPRGFWRRHNRATDQDTSSTLRGRPARRSAATQYGLAPRTEVGWNPWSPSDRLSLRSGGQRWKESPRQLKRRGSGLRPSSWCSRRAVGSEGRRALVDPKEQSQQLDACCPRREAEAGRRASACPYRARDGAGQSPASFRVTNNDKCAAPDFWPKAPDSDI